MLKIGENFRMESCSAYSTGVEEASGHCTLSDFRKPYIFIQHSEAYYRIRNEKIGGSNLDTPIGPSTDFKSEY